MDYFLIKTIHRTAVTLSIAGFIARGLGGLVDAHWVQSRAAKTLPHLIDTVLLASAIALAWALRLNPLTTPWLAAKIIALLAYIGLGMVALKPTRPANIRAVAWAAAICTFVYIVSVALTKSAWGWLGG